MQPAAPWTEQLEYWRDKKTDKLVVAPTLPNAVLVLAHDARYADRLVWDLCASSAHVSPGLPALPQDVLRPPRPGPLQDAHVTYLCCLLRAHYGTRWGWDTVARAVEAAAQQRPRDLLVEHLDGLRWDGVARLDSWLTRYLGAPDDPYVDRIGRWWLVSAVARAYAPGCQADHVLVLEGAQGSGKSTAASILGGAWGLRRLPSLRDYDRAAHALAGRWIVEVGELDAFRGRAATEIKDWLSLAQDTYRPPYARFPRTAPRRCVFLATTNEAAYLRDASGARRFWPVKIARLATDALRLDRDALLAEARDRYRAGERWWPSDTDEGEAEAIRDEQEARYDRDSWERLVVAWLDDGPTGQRTATTTGEVLQLAIELRPGEWSRDAQTRVGAILARLGWTRVRRRSAERRWYEYQRPQRPSRP